MGNSSYPVSGAGFYNDLRVNPALADKLRDQLVTEVYRDTNYLMSFFSHSVDKEINIELQMPHTKKLGDAIDFHLHLVPMANGSGTVRFTWEYVWFNIGSEIPAATSWTSGSTEIALVAADQYKHRLHDILTSVAAPTGEGYSSIFLMRLIREGTHANDDYTTGKDHGTAAANLGLVSVDAHIRHDRFGSINEASD
jgi:hypothetical protein